MRKKASGPLTLALLGASLLWTACGGQEVDPVGAALVAYEPVIEPVLHEQENISKLFVAITLDKIEPPDAIGKIKAEAVPMSKALLDKVQAIQISEPTVQGLHQTLTQAATLRLEGYQLMVDGFERKDLAAFNEGKKKLTNSKISEETYISQLDSLSKQYGVKIDFFPPSGPTAQ